MTLTAIFLILVSAFIHAWWNLRSKRSPSIAFFFVALGAGSTALLPVLFYHLNVLLLIPSKVWILLIASGASLFVYTLGLVEAYRRGDMSLIYPLVRALPVLLVPLYYLIIGNGQQIGWLGLLGMLIIGISCIVIPMKDFRDFSFKNYLNWQTFFAILAAIGTSGYSIIDDTTIRLLQQSANLNLGKTGSSTIFWVLQSIICTGCLGIYLIFSSKERGNLKYLVREYTCPPMLTGIMITASYGLILLSMPYVTNVSYVVAFRQLSIPIGATMGIFILQENRYLPKLVALASIFLGLVMVSIG